MPTLCEVTMTLTVIQVMIICDVLCIKRSSRIIKVAAEDEDDIKVEKDDTQSQSRRNLIGQKSFHFRAKMSCHITGLASMNRETSSK